MNTVLIVDTETSGIEKDATCIEVAAIRYSLTHATVISAHSSLIRGRTDNPAEKINRIPAAAMAVGRDEWATWTLIEALAVGCDAFLAHSAAFDRRFFPPQFAATMPWICTKDDLEWPKQGKPGMSLVPLALAHDLGVAVAHRAMADCDLIARLLTRAAELGVDLNQFLARGLRPKVTIRAMVDFGNNHLAREAGFHWNPKRKEWLRRMVVADAEGIGFHTRIVEAEEDE